MARIVIAGGQDHIRDVLAGWLTRHGHDAVSAATGEAALEALRRQPTDVLITHAELEGSETDGLLAMALRTCANLRRVFVIGGRADAGGVADPRVSRLTQPFSPTGLLLGVEAAEQASGAAPTPTFAFQATVLAAAEEALPPGLGMGGQA